MHCKLNAAGVLLQPVNPHNVLLLLAIQLLDDEDDDDAIRDQQQGLLLLDEHHVKRVTTTNSRYTESSSFTPLRLHTNIAVPLIFSTSTQVCVPKYYVLTSNQGKYVACSGLV